MQSLLNRIENIEPKHHVVIGAILKKDETIKFNENQTGVMVNTSMISEQSIQEISKFYHFHHLRHADR